MLHEFIWTSALASSRVLMNSARYLCTLFVADSSVAMLVLVNGAETATFPVIDEHGCHMQHDGAFVYETEGGLRISIEHEAAPASPSLAVAAAFGASSQAVVQPTPSPPSPASQPLTATPPPASADNEREVWSTRKSKFLICKYKEFKDSIGKMGGFKVTSTATNL
ncbi:uncharacterized protein LOC125943888 [Dermacentor silvarum]|uniref:uncharacterized protein LOC125943888 n=1 Tax=Dermacentor silvarum TaxID=543639 RepID=UPI002101BB54|nr:uncharacterized protein LOC125943888 [Dermacentor silvarum]